MQSQTPAPNSVAGEDRAQASPAKIQTRAERRTQLADLLGRLLARQWINRMFAEPGSTAEENQPD